jgi:hypothetical protein
MPLALGGERPRSRAGCEVYDRGMALLEQHYHDYFPHSNNVSGQ